MTTTTTKQQDQPQPLLVKTSVAAREIGIGQGTLKALAFTTPGFPRPISLISKDPGRRQYRWNLAALKEFLSSDNPLTQTERISIPQQRVAPPGRPAIVAVERRPAAKRKLKK